MLFTDPIAVLNTRSMRSSLLSRLPDFSISAETLSTWYSENPEEDLFWGSVLDRADPVERAAVLGAMNETDHIRPSYEAWRDRTGRDLEDLL